jgi:hypothetical protein
MQNLSSLMTASANLKLEGQTLAKVRFEHLPRENDLIKFEGETKPYRVKQVEYHVQKNPGGDVTCESIDILLAER